ncbi:hypothetical protein DFH01_18785 [Falsiroseomonas bella]|uniref:Uncharacterized protein n=1 Tax=Falsiroseomonas bella TaxID=2184016 RepID=A0A317F920_9PROT|nr:hypothetical protein [Falsiroseomonas bella]PWS35640.1 hypothetical protein DFH01_18785 [Falsiroseomonas bella]
MGDLAARLTGLGYQGLFLRMPPEAPRLWREPGAPAALAALAADPAAQPEARFLAAEVTAAGGGALPGAPAPLLAEAYAAALAAARLGNVWGLPGALDTPAARNLLSLGEAAIPRLRPLLGDGRELRYGGSEDATIGNAAHWRIKDFAASFIAAIRGDAFDAGAAPAARDAAIARMLAGP